MKKNVLLSVVFVLSSGLLFAQNSAALKLNLEKNKQYKLKSTTDQTISQSVNGMQQTQQVNTISYTSIKMVDGQPNFMVAEVRFDSIVNNTNSMGQSVKMNSSSAGDIKSQNMSEVMNCILNRMCSNPLFVKMDYTGKVIEIVNYKMYTDVVLKDIESIQGQAAETVKTQINNQVEMKALKTMIEGQFAYLPGKSIAKGDSWEVVLPVNSGGMSLNTTSSYKLTNIADGIATIDSEVNIKPAGSEPMVVNGMKITYDDLKGLGKSTLKVDLKTGLIKEQQGKSNIVGTMSVEVGGTNMQIPLEIQSESKTISL